MQKKIRLSLSTIMISGLFLASCGNDGTGTTPSDSTGTTTISSADSAGSMQHVDTSAMKPAEETGVMVGGSNMVASKDIVDNAAGSSDHTTLVAAVKAAGLVETLKGAGPFTVFAPTNEAFAKLPAGTVDKLLKPEMKSDLTKVLTYHVVSGAFKSSDLKDGQKLKTVQGEELTIGYKDNKWTVKDAKGKSANITIPDVISSNGVTFVIDGVLMPKK